MRRVFAVLLLAVSTAPLGAQRIPAITLRPADAVHPHEFTSVGSVRELSDGRVIVSDGRDDRLLLLDFRDGSARDIGRKGKGPGEFTMVALVHAMGADSSLMVDYFSRRWLLFHRDRIVATVPPDDPAVEATRSAIYGADAMGRVLGRVEPSRRDGITMQTERDSGAVVLVSRKTGAVDTVTKFRLSARQLSQQTNAEGRIIASSSYTTQLMPSEEAFVLFPDGALAIARLNPFRVDWRLPDGKWLRGDSLPVPRIPVTARERRAFERRNGGRSAGALPPGVPRPAGVPEPPSPAFPEFVPPFPLAYGAVLAGPNGQLLIRRSKSADFPNMTYLLVDRAARLVGTFTLRGNEQVVGVGNGWLYITERDEDDIIRLRRHPFPTETKTTG